MAGVNRWKAVVALAVLMLWASCAFSCHAHSVGTTCCDEAGEGSDHAPVHPDHCICGILFSGGFTSENSGIAIPAPNSVLFFSLELLQTVAFTAVPTSARPALPPPESVKGWQFSIHAAAQPRAPSAAS
jgi:hypothetical protein